MPDQNAVVAPVAEKCRLCGCRLNAEEEDDLSLGLCHPCKDRPEARRLGVSLPPMTERAMVVPIRPKSARDFTAAEKALISKMHALMPAQQLLTILNERLACDLGPDALPYTIDQLHTEIGDVGGATPAGGHNWASLRKLLAQAQRNGVLDAINEQVINDFAVVFSLNSKQVLSLKDIVLQAIEDK